MWGTWTRHKRAASRTTLKYYTGVSMLWGQRNVLSFHCTPATVEAPDEPKMGYGT